VLTASTDTASLLDAQTGTDAAAVWEWGVLVRVATGLRRLAAGDRHAGNDLLAAADRVSVSAA